MMAALSLGQAVLTGVGKIPITRAIKTSWHSASRKEDGSYKIDDVEPEPSARRLQSLVPWRTARRVDLKADAELRRQLALAEERLAELKSALDDMRAQRDAWQVMAQARIRPARRSALSRWQWLRSTE
jgi:ribosomal protein L29